MNNNNTAVNDTAFNTHDENISNCDDFYMFYPTQCLYDSTTDFNDSCVHFDKCKCANVLYDGSCKTSVNVTQENQTETNCTNSYLILGNLNVRSLLNKIDQLCLFVNEHNFDIIGINET